MNSLFADERGSTGGATGKTFVWGGKSKLRILLPYFASMGRRPDYVFDAFLERMEFPIDGHTSPTKARFRITPHYVMLLLLR